MNSKVMAEDQAYFEEIPWCAKLIQDRELAIIPTHCRQPKPSTGDSLLAESLNTSETTKAWLSFARKPSTSSPTITEVRALVSLGSGLNGWAGVCHGGLVGTSMDQVTGILMYADKITGISGHGGTDGHVVTARLNVSFLNAVVTPQVVLVTASVKNVQGRRSSIDASTKDASGTTLATAHSVWIRPNQEKPKL